MLQPGPNNISYKAMINCTSLTSHDSSALQVLILPEEGKIKMGFIMEFAENLILKLMEDPKERDRRARERLYAVKDRCDRTKEIWSFPIRPYGFWTFERHNSQLAWDPQISQVPGRRDPYDDLLQQNFYKSK